MIDKKARFIVFEGIDGAGKSTQIRLICERLESLGIKCSTSAEPTDMPSGKEIRRALSGEEKRTPLEMAEMFSRDRRLHNTDPECGIEKLLSEGISVISDRYYYSSLAYQGSVLGYDTVAALNVGVPEIRRPDICVFLDLSPDESLKRIGGRGEEKEIYENFDYLTKTRRTFFDVFDKLRALGENIAVIDARGSVDEVAKKVFLAVGELYGLS